MAGIPAKGRVFLSRLWSLILLKSNVGRLSWKANRIANGRSALAFQSRKRCNSINSVWTTTRPSTVCALVGSFYWPKLGFFSLQRIGNKMSIWSCNGTKRRRNLRNMKHKKIRFEEGSGNVFADLGLKDSDELFARAQIGYCVHKVIEAKKLKQREIATVLGIAQSDVSHLMNGHYSRFTTDKLLDFLKRLDRKVTIRIAPRKAGEPFQKISLTPV